MEGPSDGDEEALLTVDEVELEVEEVLCLEDMFNMSNMRWFT